MAAPILGRKLKVGNTFVASTKRISRDRFTSHYGEEAYHIPKQGEIRTLQHKGRRYVCKVILIVETRVGWYYSANMPVSFFATWISKPGGKTVNTGYKRWWQFFYLVQVIEN